MLSLCSPSRKIIAVDYDENKITTAKNCELSNHCKVQFESADILDYEISNSDIFILSDLLHYLETENQQQLINNCVSRLNSHGKIIIRDSDSSLKKRHLGTKVSEFLSTNIGFNKTRNKLSFVSREFIKKIAEQNNMHLEIIDTTYFNSNLIYVLQRKNDGQEI
ncbi:hypothetical protein ES708_27652 [subsurface metagenome]